VRNCCIERSEIVAVGGLLQLRTRLLHSIGRLRCPLACQTSAPLVAGVAQKHARRAAKGWDCRRSGRQGGHTRRSAGPWSRELAAPTISTERHATAAMPASTAFETPANHSPLNLRLRRRGRATSHAAEDSMHQQGMHGPTFRQHAPKGFPPLLLSPRSGEWPLAMRRMCSANMVHETLCPKLRFKVEG